MGDQFAEPWLPYFQRLALMTSGGQRHEYSQILEPQRSVRQQMHLADSTVGRDRKLVVVLALAASLRPLSSGLPPTQQHIPVVQEQVEEDRTAHTWAVASSTIRQHSSVLHYSIVPASAADSVGDEDR